MKVFVVISCVLFQPIAVFAASKAPVEGTKGMVVSSCPIASKVGADVLRKGGNAVDAAVAVALTLAATWPTGGNIGGGGFMLISKTDGTQEIIDYRETAPEKASKNMYLDAKGNVIPGLSVVGHRSVGVPGTIAGLSMALERHGKWKWPDVVEPARFISVKGFPASKHFVSEIEGQKNVLQKFPDSRKIYLRNGNPYKEGDVVTLPDLGETFRRLKEKGAREFYEGKTAELILKEMKDNGGLLTEKDLKEYKPVLRKPVVGNYRGYEVVTMPAPSSGGPVLLMLLNMFEPKDLKKLKFQSPDHLHWMIESMKLAFADRAEHMGDPDFVKVPVEGLINKKYAAALAKKIKLNSATPSASIKFGNPKAYESMHTTHFSVIDAEGNVVSNTYTLNESFGSGVVAKGTGVLLNNEMDDFSAKVGVPNLFGLIQNAKNSIAPHKRPLSSMTPTIVKKDSKTIMVVGSPGGPTIISSVLQTMSNVFDFDMNIQEAIDAPRFHHQWLPDEIKWEEGGLPDKLKQELVKRGHKFAKDKRVMGDVQAIFVDAKSNKRFGGSDSRFGGAAVAE